MLSLPQLSPKRGLGATNLANAVLLEDALCQLALLYMARIVNWSSWEIDNRCPRSVKMNLEQLCDWWRQAREEESCVQGGELAEYGLCACI